MIEEVIDFDVGVIGEVFVDIDENLFFLVGFNLSICIIYALEIYIRQTHQFRLCFGVVDVFHAYGGRCRLTRFLRVDDFRLVEFLLFAVFVIDVGMDGSQGTIDFTTVAAKLLSTFLPFFLLTFTVLLSIFVCLLFC